MSILLGKGVLYALSKGAKPRQSDHFRHYGATEIGWPTEETEIGRPPNGLDTL